MPQPTQNMTADAQSAYARMRKAATTMSLLNLQLVKAADIEDAHDLTAQFESATDSFIAASAELELLGFWKVMDATYIPATAPQTLAS